MNTFSETLNRLYNVNITHGIKLGLDNAHALNKHLYEPIRNFRTVHIAGTNGKGSVANYIAAGLENKYSKVGLYTSPHIATWRERIRMNGQMISEADVIKSLNEIFEITDNYNIPATFFEITTLLAFKYFARQEIDIAVIETGLGGRLDATNIVTPELSIITTIGHDHRDVLGKTLKAIAKEKAGIIKDGVPVILGPKASIVNPLNSSPCIRIEKKFENFQDENKYIAKTALEFLGVNKEAIDDALVIDMPCRRQKVEYKNKIFFLDVAHNQEALSALFQTLPSNKKYQVICSFAKDKEILPCLKIISDHSSLIHVFPPCNERLASTHLLKNQLLKLNGKFYIHPSIEQAILSTASYANDCIITGSFYIMKEAIKSLDISKKNL